MQVVESGRTRALKFELRDHRRRRATLLVKEGERRLYGQLQAEAARRFDRQPGQLHILRAADAQLIRSAPTVAASGSGSGGSGGGGFFLLLTKGSSVGWDPSGERADRIRQAAAAGQLQLEGGAQRQQQQQQQQQQAATGTQATVAFAGGTQPTAHHPDTQLTPVVHWTPAAAASTQGGGGATQVEEAGGRRQPAAAAPPATQAAMSQAPAAAGGGWKQLALEVIALLAPHGVAKNAAVLTMQQLGGERQRWLAAGAAALAAEVCRRLGVAPPPP